MATAFVVWERNRRVLLGGSQPQLFSTSAAASQYADRNVRHEGDVRQKPVYDIVTVTI